MQFAAPADQIRTIRGLAAPGSSRTLIVRFESLIWTSRVVSRGVLRYTSHGDSRRYAFPRAIGQYSIILYNPGLGLGE